MSSRKCNYSQVCGMPCWQTVSASKARRRRNPEREVHEGLRLYWIRRTVTAEAISLPPQAKQAGERKPTLAGGYRIMGMRANLDRDLQLPCRGILGTVTPSRHRRENLRPGAIAYKNNAFGMAQNAWNRQRCE